MTKQVFIINDDGEMGPAFSDWLKANQFIESINDHGVKEESLGRPWLSADGPEVEEVTVHESIHTAIEEFNEKWRIVDDS